LPIKIILEFQPLRLSGLLTPDGGVATETRDHTYARTLGERLSA
jgi:hypothetical protein